MGHLPLECILESETPKDSAASPPAPVKANAPSLKNPPKPVKPIPYARKARPKRRHFWIFLSFLVMVVAPASTTYWYLTERAVDQYTSTLGFTVRQENVSSPVDLLGGLTTLGASSSTDTDILFEFIQSQQLVELVDAKLDLVKLYSEPENDPIFSFKPDGSIEDLVGYWGKMVKVYYNSKVGLIEVNVLAFNPMDARNIAEEIFEQSSLMINDLSAIAQADTTKFSREELDKAEARLKAARLAISRFRADNQMVDPNSDLQGQMGLLSSLQQRLADAFIELDLLKSVARTGDPRIEQSQRKITVIKARIQDERAKLGTDVDGGSAFSSLVGEFEELKVDLDFAERAYLSALSAYDGAVAEARRKSRYLAAYVKPTLAESAQNPKRITLLSLISFFLFLAWAIFVLVIYSVKDRR
jgi:capsular polysaccharide transport system permease protein